MTANTTHLSISLIRTESTAFRRPAATLVSYPETTFSCCDVGMFQDDETLDITTAPGWDDPADTSDMLYKTP